MHVKMVEVNNKVVLITGGANGIGAGVVKECLQRGARHVSFLDIDKNVGTQLENELSQNYGKHKVKFIECDVTNDEQLFGAYKTVSENNDGIDLVVNNAGIAQETLETYKKLIDINFKAVVTSTFKGLEMMRKDHGGKGGTIINVSSIVALFQMSPTVFVYFGSKSAVLQFSNCIGMEKYYEKTGVRVITVCFGCTDTAIFGGMKSFDPLVEEEMEVTIKVFPFQSAEFAARSLVDVYEVGTSGDTWAIVKGKPPYNLTERVKKAYEILSEGLVP